MFEKYCSFYMGMSIIHYVVVAAGFAVLIHIIYIKKIKIKKLILSKESLDKEIEERKAIEEKLRKTNAIIEHSNDAIIGSLIDGTILSWNKSAELIYGYTEEEALGRNINIIIPEDKGKEAGFLSKKLEEGKLIKDFETRRKRKNGQEIYVAITLSPIKDEEGNIISVAAIDKDITEKRRHENEMKQNTEELSAVYGQLSAAEEELKQQIIELKNQEKALKLSEERYKLALDGANDAIWELDFEKNQLFISDKWESISGYNDTNITNVRYYLMTLVKSEDKKTIIKDFKDHIEGKNDFYESQFRLKTKNGVYKWINARGKVLRNSEGRPVKMAGSITDVDETRKIQDKIKHMAYYDLLTELPNRFRFLEDIEKVIIDSKEQNKNFAVIFLDMDDFKIINDTLGHDYGDEVIINVASIIKNNISKRAKLYKAGGDEFIILLEDINELKDIEELCKNIIKAIKSPLFIMGQKVYTKLSMGIAIFPYDGVNSKELLRNSDTAITKAKQSGKNTYSFFRKEMSENIIRRVSIENGLREALSNGELRLFYQPQLERLSGRISGLEALIRWKSRELGWVSPAEFISIAEESGMILDIGKWVLLEAFNQNKEWKEKGYKFDTIAVNISPMQLYSSSFIEDIKEMVESIGVEPSSIEIEITENVLMSLYDKNINTLKTLRGMDFNIALDDFGTGYSSLNYLRVLPINKLKIDKSFIDNIEKDKNNKDITEGIIQLSHKMGIEVIAEGVEHKKQLEILKDMGCDIIQGYYFSKALPPEEVEKLLKQ